MKPHPLTNALHTAPSHHASRPVASRTPRPAPQQPEAPTERLTGAPSAHAEKILSRRMHRKQAAVYLGLSLSWLDKARLRGDGPPYLKIGGRVVYDSADLDGFLAHCRHQSTSETR